ncbi:hypothetical protein GA0116959_101237 [Acinetobacter albensis]|uniref:Uncharacterized protein n=1 Tax=Acinetobacter albensis TaxID=1673609 RepID=A0A1C4GSP8_9GAMM|nr:hypothetical protein GA0116959_101237 [Acinetobacter albensis]
MVKFNFLLFIGLGGFVYKYLYHLSYIKNEN